MLVEQFKVAKRRPLVLVPACVRQLGSQPYHVVQTKYMDAIELGAGCQPLILPSMGGRTDWDTVLDLADGVLLSGSPTNIDPGLFGEQPLDPELPLDAARDATSLPLIHKILARGMPLLAICRGMQELNVALGGSLHQAVHAAGFKDHREDSSLPVDQQYDPAHSVQPEADGILAQILGSSAPFMVNSLHGQGIARLADGLRVEARAADGLIEACSAQSGFALAVQWHPEWQLAHNPVSMKMFQAFGAACRAYQKAAIPA